MSTLAYTAVAPWQDQWSKPSIDQLLVALEDQHREVLCNFFERLETLDCLQQSLTWQGSGWHWAIQYDLTDPQGNQLETFCYVIARPEVPFACMPLTRETYHRLPMRRLPKLMRTAVRSAKCCVTTHWTTVNLTANSDLEHLMDLAKRKHRYAMEPFKTSKSAKTTGKRQK